MRMDFYNPIQNLFKNQFFEENRTSLIFPKNAFNRISIGTRASHLVQALGHLPYNKNIFRQSSLKTLDILFKIQGLKKKGLQMSRNFSNGSPKLDENSISIVDTIFQ